MSCCQYNLAYCAVRESADKQGYAVERVSVQVASTSEFTEIPAAVLNETGLIGIRLSAADAPSDSQSIVGIIDCGSSFSAVNWKGAALLGLPGRQSESYEGQAQMFGVGVDGRPMPLSTHSVRLTFQGDPIRVQNMQGTLRFAPPPPTWNSWDAVDIAVGDLPLFSQVLGDGSRPFQGPAALLGLDVLSQRRVVLEARVGSGRKRRLFVSNV
mmetsp:Transcript_19894/g.47389  ORF Transcript_19894/g.47389 Transcript_19894/m.47389 type:complete len:212 (-) Transcript_19894:127-762(-)